MHHLQRGRPTLPASISSIGFPRSTRGSPCSRTRRRTPLHRYRTIRLTSVVRHCVPVVGRLVPLVHAVAADVRRPEYGEQLGRIGRIARHGGTETRNVSFVA